jgi:hypothetical protein
LAPDSGLLLVLDLGCRIGNFLSLQLDRFEGGLMNWTKVILAGLASGIVATMANYVMHGMILGNTYQKYALFTKEEANPLWFFLVGICIGLAAAVLFAKTRGAWANGVVGGATFGFFLGLVSFFLPFYDSLVLEGFPYFLSWCWGGVNVIGFVIYGVILGAVYKSA